MLLFYKAGTSKKSNCKLWVFSYNPCIDLPSTTKKPSHIPIKLFLWLMKLNIPLLLLFAYSDYCSVKRSVWTSFAKLQLCCSRRAFLLTLLQLLQAILEKRATIKANSDHTEILDAGSQQGLVGECGPERVQ